MSGSADKPDYTLEPSSRFFNAIRRIVLDEIDPRVIVSFISEIDLTEIEEIRAQAGAQRPSYTAFVAKAAVLALLDYPYANRRVVWRWLPFAKARLQTFQRYDVAVAAERDVPGTPSVAFADVIRDVDKLSLVEITDWLRAVAESDETTNKQWRDFSRGITRLPLWLSRLVLRLPYYFPSLWVKWRGGAVFISSPAKYGVDSVVSSWTAPLGFSFGLVKPRAVVRDGQVVARTTFNLLLSFDRTVMAGAPAARYFKRVVDILEHARTEMAAFLPGPPQPPSAAQVQRSSS
jgi:pyruvate/2-oxoglutarate dehydrogenase complex dihydrolipoamide acyltransferase (E2) component